MTFNLSTTNRTIHNSRAAHSLAHTFHTAIGGPVLFGVKEIAAMLTSKVTLGFLLTVNFYMAIFTKGLTVRDIIPQFWIIGPRFYMVGFQLAAAYFAHLASVIVLFENIDSPFLVFVSGDSITGLFIAFVFWVTVTFLELRGALPFWGFGSALDTAHNLCSNVLFFPGLLSALTGGNTLVLGRFKALLGAESTITFFDISLPGIKGIAAILANLLDYAGCKFDWFWHIASKMETPTGRRCCCLGNIH